MSILLPSGHSPFRMFADQATQDYFPIFPAADRKGR
jgi:hypothetical protein